jgi:urease accessory protein
MLSGPFGGGVSEAFEPLALFLMLLAVGLWAWQLGWREPWRLAAAVLAGLTVGAVLREVGWPPPYGRWAVPAALVVLGLLAAFHARVPSLAAAAAAAVAAVYHGDALLAVVGRGAVTVAGFAAGVLFVTASGVGIGAMLTQIAARRGLQAAGGAIAVVGVLMLAGVV